MGRGVRRGEEKGVGSRGAGDRQHKERGETKHKTGTYGRRI